jgi:glycosyltransferase involved in cell wall biosynthesis
LISRLLSLYCDFNLGEYYIELIYNLLYRVCSIDRKKIMKKILFIGDSNSIHIKKWVDYFCDNNYQVYLATFASNNCTKCENIFYLSSQKPNTAGGNLYYLLFVPTLSKIIRKIKPDFINAHFSYSYGFIACMALKLSKISTSFSIVCHGSDVLDVPYGICKYLNKIVFKYAEKIIAVSNQIADGILKQGYDPSNLCIGQYGVEQDILQKEDNREIDIISNRSYVPNSQIDKVLELLNDREFHNKKVVMILPLICSNKLEEFKMKYSFIEFYPAISHHEMIKMVKKSKVYLSATKSDGSSLSLLEAMACGCYPVLSNIPSNREWVVDGLNGVLFNSFDNAKQILILLLKENSDFFEDNAKKNQNLISKKAVYYNQMEKFKRFLFKD